MLKNQQKKKKQLNKYLSLTSIPIQMGITIYFGVKLGVFLDKKMSLDKPLFLVICILLSLLISLYSIIKQLNKIEKNNRK